MEIVTNQMFQSLFLTGVEQNLQGEFADTQQISSNKKVNQPSDDPAALSQIVGYKTELSEITEYQNAITAAKAPLQSLDSSLSNLNSTLTTANELAIQAANGTTDAKSMQDIADEVQQLFSSTVTIANTNVGGKYIYAGAKSNVNPIDPNTGELISDNSSINIDIGVGASVTTNVNAGSLFSFARVNGTADSTDAILPPTVDWTNNGANTIPDADPLSALETSASTSPIYTINPGDSISINGTSFALTAGSYDTNQLVAQLNTLGSAVTFSYDAANNKFELTGPAGTVLNWQGSAAATPTTMNVEQALGFNSIGDQTIGAQGYVESNNTVGKFTASDDIFTTNGGALNIAVSGSTTPSSGAFVINSSNNAVSLNGTTYYIANGIYTGAGLANALENDLSLSASGTPAIAAPIIDVSYDSSGHKFSISDAGAGDSIDLTAAGTSTIGSIMGFKAASATELLSSAITSDNAVGDVNLAAGSTLQDVRDAMNAAGAGVKAQVVNNGTSADPDFRLVVASDPVGNSANIDISPLSTALTTTGIADASGTGINMLSYDKTTGDNMTLGTNINNYNYITQTSANDSIVIDNGTNGNIANNQIVVQENGFPAQTLSIDPGTYTASQLAADIQTNLNNIATTDVSGNTYSVTYDPNAGKFNINQTNAAGVAVDLEWNNSNTTAAQLLGFNPGTITNAGIAAGGGSVQSDNPVLANYYSFNNNYLNDKYILRALNFEKVSLQSNDSGRVQQAMKYTTDLSDAVSQVQATVGAAENQVNYESSYQTSVQSNTQVYLSNADDTDLVSVSSDLSLRQTALQALRTVTTDVLNQSLFDFIKPS